MHPQKLDHGTIYAAVYVFYNVYTKSWALKDISQIMTYTQALIFNLKYKVSLKVCIFILVLLLDAVVLLGG